MKQIAKSNCVQITTPNSDTHTRTYTNKTEDDTWRLCASRIKVARSSRRDKMGYRFPRSIQLIDPSRGRASDPHAGCRRITRADSLRKYVPFARATSLRLRALCRCWRDHTVYLYIIRIRNDMSGLEDVYKRKKRNRSRTKADRTRRRRKRRGEGRRRTTPFNMYKILRFCRVTSSATVSSIEAKCYIPSSTTGKENKEKQRSSSDGSLLLRKWSRKKKKENYTVQRLSGGVFASAGSKFAERRRTRSCARAQATLHW